MIEYKKRFLEKVKAEKEYFSDRLNRIGEGVSETQSMSYAFENARTEHVEALEELESELFLNGAASAYMLRVLWA